MASEVLSQLDLKCKLSKTSKAGLIIFTLVFFCLVIQYSRPLCCNDIGPTGDRYSQSNATSYKTHHFKSMKVNISNITDVTMVGNLTSTYVESHSEEYLKMKRLMKWKGALSTVAPVTRPTEDPVQCSLLFKGDTSEIERVRLKLSGETTLSDVYDYGILEKTTRCAEYLRNSGYITRPQSQEEEAFPLAFTIRMHQKVIMVEKLLQTIYHPQNVYCIHIDKKAPLIVHRAMAAVVKCLPNVFITSRNVNYVYASFSAVESDMICMEDLLNSTVRWQYLLNMAGSEFPLKTNLELVRALKILNGTNDIEQVYWSSRFDVRINSTATINPTQNIAQPSDTPKDPFHLNFTLMKGCSYNTFSREFVQWVLSDPVARDFINWTRDTIAPDETVWSTLNNLPGAPGGYHVEVAQAAKTFLSREIIWAWSSAYCWEQHFVRGICILSSPDLQWLSGRWEFFANKFDVTHDHYAIDCLAEWLRNRTAHPEPEKYMNWDRITKLPHVRLHTPN